MQQTLQPIFHFEYYKVQKKMLLRKGDCYVLSNSNFKPVLNIHITQMQVIL